MARPFKELRDRMSPEARQRVDRRVRETLLEMNLQELRQHVAGVTQSDLAELMKVTQGAISQLEKRHDVLLSKLAEYIHALGGELALIARFPSADVRITQFSSEKSHPSGNPQA
jgi:transcriptional regulator with XRE-family HTH domain